MATNNCSAINSKMDEQRAYEAKARASQEVESPGPYSDTGKYDAQQVTSGTLGGWYDTTAKGWLKRHIADLRAEANRLEQLERALPAEMIPGANEALQMLLQRSVRR